MPSRATSPFSSAAVIALALALPAGALAKQKPAAEPDPAPAAATPPEADAPVPELEMTDPDPERRHAMEEAQTMNRGEMRNLAKKHDRSMALALVEGERAKMEAIRQRDALKLSCIQDRLARMKLTRRLAVERMSALGRDDVQG